MGTVSDGQTGWRRSGGERRRTREAERREEGRDEAKDVGDRARRGEWSDAQGDTQRADARHEPQQPAGPSLSHPHARAAPGGLPRGETVTTTGGQPQSQWRVGERRAAGSIESLVVRANGCSSEAVRVACAGDEGWSLSDAIAAPRIWVGGGGCCAGRGRCARSAWCSWGAAVGGADVGSGVGACGRAVGRALPRRAADRALGACPSAGSSDRRARPCSESPLS